MRKDCELQGSQKAGLLGDLLTRTAVSVALGVSERTLDRWHALRIGPPRIRMGRRILYRRQALENWLLLHESGSLDEGPRSTARRYG